MFSRQATTLIFALATGAAALLSACADDGGADAPTRCEISDVAQCDVNATCSVVGGVATCTCTEGYGGNGVSCQENDACGASPPPCDVNASCKNASGVAACTCDDGWDGDGVACTNIDECGVGTDNCDGGSEDCVDNDGSFDCVCKDGFLDDGNGCVIDAATFVADISSRPVLMEIAGVGSYAVGGLGRVAIEVEVVSTPGVGIIIERMPSAIVYHNITLRNVSAENGSSLTDLANWAGAGTSTESVMHLSGLGTEILDLDIFGMKATSSDVTITDGKLAEIVISVTSVSENYYVPPAALVAPNDTTVVGIETVANPGFAAGDITPAAVDTAESLTLQNLKNYEGAGTFGNASHLIAWMEASIGQFASNSDINRRSLAQIFSNGAGDEIDRINCYEVFPSFILFFNPLKIYGQSQLVDLTITTERCLDGT